MYQIYMGTGQKLSLAPIINPPYHLTPVLEELKGLEADIQKLPTFPTDEWKNGR
jgi:hypothetical protein